jgi:hypothetical protein
VFLADHNRIDAIAAHLTVDHGLPGIGLTHWLTAFQGGLVKYGVAWLLGVPFSVIVLWFLANQIGCGF